MNFPRYPRYKDSGVEWLGEVPEHWTLRRFKRLFRERDERSTSGSELLLSVSAYTGVSPRADIIEEGEFLSRAESLEGYKICSPGDLVMNIMLAWNRGLAFTAYAGIVSPSYAVFRLIDDSVPEFLNYLLRCDRYLTYYRSFSTGVIDSRLRLYPEVFARLVCILPSVADQLLIVRFLDRETARIDRLVDEQRHLMALLQEKRQAVISHAVTKGLNADVRMKSSRVDWLGDIPAHWEVRRLKHLSSFLTSGPRGWSDLIGDTGALFIQSGDLTEDLAVDFEHASRVNVSAGSETTRTALQTGDIIVCITGAKTGNVAVATSLAETAYVNQHLALVRPNRHVLSRFLAFVLKSRIGQTHFTYSQYGLKQGLSLEDVRETPVCLPPLEEQRRILDFIEHQMSRFAALACEAQLSVEVLAERRSALISAAVTGQIDVGSLRPSEAA